MAMKSPWRDVRDHAAWLAALPEEQQRAYHRQNYRAQLVLLWLAIIAMIALGAFRTALLIPLPVLWVIFSVLRLKRTQKSLGYK